MGSRGTQRFEDVHNLEVSGDEGNHLAVETVRVPAAVPAFTVVTGDRQDRLKRL